MISHLDTVTKALILEDRCALNYVVNVAWPTKVDAEDQDAEDLFRKSWKSEEPFLSRLVSLISDHETDAPLMDSSFGFPPARLNFARWSHIAEVLPGMVEDECDILEGLAAQLSDASAKSLFESLLRVKRAAADNMVELNQKQSAARAAKAAAGGKEAEAPAAAGAAEGELAFRDADMPIDERMTKAATGDKATKLWAAMAQTDCTACGYDCEGYARAIAAGEEKDLGKCVPGEDDTANMIKKIMTS